MADPKDKDLLVRFVRTVLEEHVAGRLPTDKAVVELATVALDNPDTAGVADYMRAMLCDVWRV